MKCILSYSISPIIHPNPWVFLGEKLLSKGVLEFLYRKLSINHSPVLLQTRHNECSRLKSNTLYHFRKMLFIYPTAMIKRTMAFNILAIKFADCFYFVIRSV